MSFFKRYNHGTQSDIGVVLLVEGDHWPVVHTIDMVTGQDEYVVARGLHDETEILVDRVGGTLVPVRLVVPHIWLEQANASFLPVQVPGFANAYMVVQ